MIDRHGKGQQTSATRNQSRKTSHLSLLCRHHAWPEERESSQSISPVPPPPRSAEEERASKLVQGATTKVEEEDGEALGVADLAEQISRPAPNYGHGSPNYCTT
jgi:hypothetical protein